MCCDHLSHVTDKTGFGMILNMKSPSDVDVTTLLAVVQVEHMSSDSQKCNQPRKLLLGFVLVNDSIVSIASHA